MGYLSLNSAVLERYFSFLKRFDNDTKKKLIVKLTNSLGPETQNPIDLSKLFGAWQDDRSTQEIIDEIRDSRVEPRDIVM
ncbi:MAG: hypothetical protein ACJASR_001863 [Psychroserpens sp.]|jgi:hypothetical protein